MQAIPVHEYSIIRSVFATMAEVARRHPDARITAVHMRVGEFSGVDAELLQSAFNELSPEYWDERPRLIVKPVPLQAQCQTCRQTFSVDRFRFVCSYCGATDVTVVAGDEMVLDSVGLETIE